MVVGAAGVDTLVYLADDRPDFTRDSTMVRTVDAVGHAGGYSSRGFARLGRRTGFIGILGNDWAGQLVRSAFAADGVAIAAEAVDPTGTARSVNLMTPDGRRRAFYDGRGHDAVAPPAGASDVLAAGPRLALFHLSDWCRRVLPDRSIPGLLVATDLQDVADPDDAYRADFVRASDVLFASAAHLPEPEQAAQRWLARATGPTGTGPRLVVVGMGSRGALAITEQVAVQVPPPALDLPIIDTNGAGDSLATGVLDYLLRVVVGDSLQPWRDVAQAEEQALRSALTFGQCLARWTCAIRGSDRLATRTDAERLLRAADGRAS